MTPGIKQLLRYPVLLAFIALLGFPACNTFEQVKKSNDINYKLTKANEYYEKKQYSKANELFYALLPVVKGTKNFEPMYYRYAYSYYYMDDLLNASLHFKNFTEYFPASRDAEECYYMYAVSLYRLSPKGGLEQTSTVKAAEAMQEYLNTYPNSKRAKEANEYLAKIAVKLERKVADAARLYYNISQFKAASVTFESAKRTYPDSPLSDYYQYMIVKSLYFYARQSLETRQEERYTNAVLAFGELKDNFPNSKYLRDAEIYSVKAENNIKHIRNESK